MAARGSYRNLVCLVGVLIISRTLQHAHGASYPQCLPDAVPESERKSLVGEQGLYPIGIWVNGWPAGYVTAAVVRILLAEKIGFNTVERGPGPSTVDGFYALTGCATPTNVQDRGCSASMTTQNHISVEGWTEAYASTWAAIERDYPQNAPQNLGNMGLILEFYRGFNVSWTSAAKYFDPPSSVDKSLLKPCQETRLMVSQAMTHYVEFTADWDGVETVTAETGTTIKGRCWDGYFWYPPACRDDASKCVIFFTGGWNMEETMQKAAGWNMPLSPVVAIDWDRFTKLPLQHRSTFYWWVPDPTFLSLNPMEITFPPFDRTAFARGDQRNSLSALSIDKYVSKDLQALAPSAEQLVRNFLIDMEAVNEMLRDQLQTGGSHSDVACRWVQRHADIWQTWLPDPTKCFAGFGLYHLATKSFMQDRSNTSGLTCQACPSGRFSSKLIDEDLTFVCRPCPSGSKQASGASLQCDPCNAGEYQDVNGSTSCKRCRLGHYQDQEGFTGCIKCPLGTSTYSVGAASLRDCVCTEGTIDTETSANISGDSSGQGQAHCVPCSEGLHCPLGSNLTSLKTGDSIVGEEFVPKLLKGYFSTEEKPIEVFKCQSSEHCLGGMPGQCAGEREVTSIPCADCPRGTSWSGDECVVCSGGVGVMWSFACCLFFLGLTIAFYVMSPKIAATATPVEAMGMIVGITGCLCQSIAIVGLTTVTWPEAFKAIAGPSQVLLLDLEGFAITCFISVPTSLRYIGTTLLFPAGVLWLLLCFLMTSWLPWLRKLCKIKPKQSWVRTMNVIGHFLQEGFGTMSALALKPLMCYEHPNGEQSLLKHAGVFCNSGEHSAMMVTGLVLLISFVLGFLGVCTWAVWNIPKWSISKTQRVAGFSFLVNRFTMYRWWYGVPILARGTLLSSCVVIATDFPPAQAAMVTLVISSFLLSHMRLLPWKTPVVNLLEGWVLSMLLFQVAITPTFKGGKPSDIENFNERVSLILLSSIAISLALIALAVALTILSELTARKCANGAFTGDWVVLNLGRRPDSQVLLEKIKQVAQELLAVEPEIAHKGFLSLHPGDVARISDSIDMISTDLLGTYHTNAISMNRVITFSRAHQRVRASLTPGEVAEGFDEVSDQSSSEVASEAASEVANEVANEVASKLFKSHPAKGKGDSL